LLFPHPAAPPPRVTTARRPTAASQPRLPALLVDPATLAVAAPAAEYGDFGFSEVTERGRGPIRRRYLPSRNDLLFPRASAGNGADPAPPPREIGTPMRAPAPVLHRSAVGFTFVALAMLVLLALLR
jgi:hypothetical protein